MAKLTGPLLSFGADGQIGKAMVTSKWRGIAYARQYVVPANPRTTAQQNNRTRFALLREMWKLAPAAVRAPWDAFAKGRPFLPFNKFVGENNRLLVGQTTFATAIMSPGALGGLPPEGVVAVAGGSTGEIDVTVTPPSQLPIDWSIVECGAAAFQQQNPIGLFTGPFVAGTDDTAPYEITLTGLGPAEVCAVFGWVVYERNDGKLAYSVSLYDEATSGA
jgi:hypothetical protein